MTFLIDCPNCGPREALEFGYGGETTRRAGPDADDRELAGYLYFRRNVERVADRVVAAPRRMPAVVPRRTTHLDERDPPDVLADGARGGSRVTERLEEAPGEGIRRDRPVTIVFEGRKVAAFEGDTVGSALAAAGVTITGALVQVPPAAGPAVHDGVVRELPDADRRHTQRPRLHRARARRHAGGTPERLAVRRPRHPRLAEHVLVHDAAGLLLQDLPAAPLGLAHWSSRSSGRRPASARSRGTRTTPRARW